MYGMKTKKIAIMAILLAVNVAVSFIFIPVGENLRIYFTFLITMIIAANFSFGECVLYAALEDIISFFIYPTGPFFIGYTITAVLSIAIYNLFLYKKVTLARIAISKALVNILINVGLGSLWSKILYSNSFIYYAAKSLLKNIVLLPFEIIAFWLIYKAVQPLFDKYNNY